MRLFDFSETIRFLGNKRDLREGHFSEVNLAFILTYLAPSFFEAIFS